MEPKCEQFQSRCPEQTVFRSGYAHLFVHFILALRQTLEAICNEISSTLDLQESRKKGRFIIKSNKEHRCCRAHGETLQFDCPDDLGPGDTFPYLTHYGEQVTIEVPNDVQPGEPFNHFVPHEQFYREEQEARSIQLTLVVPEDGDALEGLDGLKPPAKTVQAYHQLLRDPVWVDVPSHLAAGDEFETTVEVQSTGRPWSNQCSICNLEELKYHYDGMDNLLDNLAKEEAAALYTTRHDFADLDLKLVFYQQFGYLLSLASNNPQLEQILAFRGRKNDDTDMQGGKNDGSDSAQIAAHDLDQMAELGYDFQFESKEGSTHGETRYFFRNSGTRNMDDHFGNIVRVTLFVSDSFSAVLISRQQPKPVRHSLTESWTVLAVRCNSGHGEGAVR